MRTPRFYNIIAHFNSVWYIHFHNMKIPNSENAVVDIEKLRDYCLSKAHPRGRHKARVFETVLGFTETHISELRDILLNEVRTNQAILSEKDDYGQRYILDIEINGPKGKAVIRSLWIVRNDENFPRFITCYIL